MYDALFDDGTASFALKNIVANLVDKSAGIYLNHAASAASKGVRLKFAGAVSPTHSPKSVRILTIEISDAVEEGKHALMGLYCNGDNLTSILSDLCLVAAWLVRAVAEEDKARKK
eukprot:2431727-Lingulodinium_polyedra.AAC.1